MDNYFVYILRCCDDSFYTGYTKDIDARLELHRKGAGAKYVRSRLPLELVYLEQWMERSMAMRREKEIKKLPRKKKEELVDSITLS